MSHDTDSIDSEIYTEINNINFCNNIYKKKTYNEIIENIWKINEKKEEVEHNIIIKETELKNIRDFYLVKNTIIT